MTSTKNTTDLPKTKLAQTIADAMAERGMSINDLAKAIDVTYEPTRRIVRGDASPSRHTLQRIAQVLKLNTKELLDECNAAKIVGKYGNLPYTLAGKDPSLEPVERLWSHLTEQQKGDVITMISAWAKRARAAV